MSAEKPRRYMRLKPKPIRGLKGLVEIPIYARAPAVYFLCLGDEVVYVGQSTNPAGRIAEHAASSSKRFDRVYALNVPAEELNNVEGAFIQLLKPTQQYGGLSGRISLPRMSLSVLEALEPYVPRSWLPNIRRSGRNG